MIKTFRMLRNIGQFDSVSAGATLPLARVTLLYAENGRGKTTLAGILRALASGEALPIVERRRLGATHPPHIVIDCSDGPPSQAVFENGSWSRTLSNIAIFDDAFVDENVFSGLTVEADHRQNLHELILGSQGVDLGQRLQALVAKIEKHNADLRALAVAIPEDLRCSVPVEQFCNLPFRPDVDEALQAAKRLLAAALQQDVVRDAELLPQLVLPSFEMPLIQEVLLRDLPSLDEQALEKVEAHVGRIGLNGETWVAEGMRRVDAGDLESCPFCAQDLSGSPILAHYRAYFSDAYRQHMQGIAQLLTQIESRHGGDVVAGVERVARVLGERRQFWTQYVTIPELGLDTAALAHDWRATREALATAIRAKQSTPLDSVVLSAEILDLTTTYQVWRDVVETLNETISEANRIIKLAKEQAAASDIPALEKDVVELQAIKNRHAPEIAARCDAYLVAKKAKSATEKARDRAKADLDEYRRTAFPGYEAAINQYLERFNAGFRLDQVIAADTRGGPTCTYNILINNTAVAIAGRSPAAGEPSFRNTLSSGDRNTLALAFFFASLDQDPQLADRIVVIDDPLSSLDDHRSLATVHQVRRLAGQVRQVIIMSHNKTFLCRIWDWADRADRAALQVVRDGAGSTLSPWNVDNDAITDHDRNHAALREYAAHDGTNSQEVARAIRPVLESFLRVAVPEHFPPSTLLGTFRNTCDQRVGKPNEILSVDDARELDELTEYANRFHHDTNPAWETEVINDGELHGFVVRALAFCAPRP
jgi:wobble nucleotide-excising tRNase